MVLAILGIAMAVAAPAIGVRVQDARQTEVEVIADLLRTARAATFRTGRRVCVEAGPDRLRVRFPAAAGVSPVHRLTGRIRSVDPVMQNRRVVCFDPDGTANPVRWLWISARDSAVIRVEAWDASVSVER